jgi:hypothetical protein
MLDIPWLLAQLDTTMVDTAVLELWTPPATSIEETLVRESEWVARSLSNLAEIDGIDFR